MREALAACDFPGAAELQIAAHFERVENFGERGEDIAEAGLVACRGFTENDASGAAAGAVADASGFKDRDR